MVAERVVRRGDLAQLRDQRGVFRKRGRVINRLEPLQRPLPVVQGLAIPLQDDGLDLFRLEMELPRDAGDGPGPGVFTERCYAKPIVAAVARPTGTKSAPVKSLGALDRLLGQPRA